MKSVRWGFYWLSLSLWLVACKQEEPPAFSFYENRIAPVIEVGCALQTTGCHVARKDQTAVGNLDLSSYDALLRRVDVLPATGPYPVGQLLLKGGDPVEIAVQTFDPPDPKRKDELFVPVRTDVRHAGGALLREGSDGYAAVKNWVQQGFSRNGQAVDVQRESEGECRSGAGNHPGFDPKVAPSDEKSYRAFVDDVEPVLVARCAGSSCHGTPVADLHLSCGRSEEEHRWNYFAAVAHVDLSSSLSELLRRPLSTLRGGTYHEGGDIFASTDDSGYQVIRKWIDDLVKRAPNVVRYLPEDEGLRFFGNYVQPILVRKGCMFQNCHSPAMFHDLRLRGGSNGVFSRIAFDRNYEMSRLLLAPENADPNQSRLIAKNLFPPHQDGRGVAHRGGALFEDFEGPAEPSACAGIDVTAMKLSDVPAYCVLVQWHALERKLSIARGEISESGDQKLLWVSRPVGVGDVRDFDTYRPNANLWLATLDMSGDVPSLGASQSLLSGCGLTPSSADVRGPAVSWDAKKIAFAARASAAEPLRIYVANSDGSGCAKEPDLSAKEARRDGILLHDFDPAFAPDGRIVFASTRGRIADNQGPTRTRSELRPNANLYVFDPKNKEVRQLTFLNNQEIQPSFMADGRLIFTTEKRAPDFFQLAGRRLNLDGGDYHPLFAQRKSVGFQMATEIIELSNRNLAIVAAPAFAKDGAGTIAIVNRSIGPDQSDRNPDDKFYVHSLSFPRPGAFDKQRGVYRSPAATSGRHVIVSCDQDATKLDAGNFDFDLCALDPATGHISVLGGEASRADVEGVVVFAREYHGVFQSRIDEANAHTRVEPGQTDAIVQFNDLPMLATLLFANTREGRPIDERIQGFEVLESRAVPADATSFADLDGDNVVKDDYGQVFVGYDSLGAVELFGDGSAKMRVPGGRPVVLRMLDGKAKPLSFQGEAAPFEGEMTTREEYQFYPGERANQSFPRRHFNGMCGGCHGSISGFELDVAVDVDVLTSASRVDARDARPVDLVR